MSEPMPGVLVDLSDLWAPDADALRVATAYLVDQPEQGEWGWEDHCEGIAGGILHALHLAGWEVRRG